MRTNVHPGWNALERRPPAAGIAVAVRPSQERVKRAGRSGSDLLPNEPASRPNAWTPAWHEALLDGLAGLIAGRQLPGAWVPALMVPRFVHGQSQGICDLFGARVEAQDDGYYFVHPLPPDPGTVDAIEPKDLHSSIYWHAVEWIRYARAATDGKVEFRNPVMTGPFDTANYLLGTTVLMEWVYTEGPVLHRLLDKITDTIIAMLGVLRDAAGGVLHGDALACIRNAFCLCSECRALVSAEIYEAFEAPYLAQIGGALGPFGIHSCGSWERTVPSAIADPNLRAMNGQVRENDLAALCSLAQGEILLSIGPSTNLDERYTWPDVPSFVQYVLETTPGDQPLELVINESDIAGCGGALKRLLGMVV